MSTLFKDEKYRNVYLIIFCSFLFLSIVTTICIYYCVRYKRKYFFDAAGRKFIVSTGDYSNLVNKLLEIIQFDNKRELEETVNNFSIGLLQTRNELNQNLLHLCGIYGARDCLLYIVKFGLVNANEKDTKEEYPIELLMKNHSENTKRNKEMFLWLSRISDMQKENKEGIKLANLMNEWQKEIYESYLKKPFLQRKYIITTETA